MFALSIGSALAANPYAVGDTVRNPLTNAEETVKELAGDNMVLTEEGHAIYVGPTAIGTQIEDPEEPGSLVTITGNHVNEETGLVDSITVKDDADPPDTREIAMVYNPDLSTPDDGDPGDEGGSVDVPVPSGNANVFVDKRRGARGADGRDGGGIRICIIWCFTIGVNATSGSAGGAGPMINDTIDGPDITTVTPGLHGAWVSSLGGNGGVGGDAYGINIPAGQGGRAGVGGNVTVTSNVDITTAGDQAYGIFAQSRAGAGGSGGNGYILSSGAGGGPAAQGGNVAATNNGVITTFGDGASGMMIQSLGGGGGAGGDSYGIVGVAGSASQGGHGGNATATNNGRITTSGVAAHGVVVQSIGGSGGDGGSSGGISAVGGTGNTGGNGGHVTVTNSAGGHITTGGDHSIGILAQSVGGGGGNGGTAGGIAGIGGSGEGGGAGSDVTVTNAGHVHTTTQDGSDAHAIVAQSIGGGGGTGGVGAGLVGIGGNATKSAPNDGGRVTVSNLAGGEISTAGTASHGILAQSIGGGGGSGAASGGLVAVGGNGSAAGAGKLVTVTNAGSISTAGVDSKGILAQSIGGGGGSANASGGLVALGGKGGSGGNGGSVAVTNEGQITTLERGADGVVAQSIGGGGGDGGSTGGLVALGGSGTSGGAGSTVQVSNSGSITTGGARARGVLAQSIGGGGGNGGDSGGLVSLGGSGSVASNGGNVTVANTGTIATVGNAASAIEAESIGGGGGSGGTSGGVFFTLGGTGGGGGDAGTVTLNNSRNLTTEGDDSHGLFGQSIGGGGGNGGNSVSVSAFVGVAIGGSGGKGGAGADVTVNSTEQTVVVDGQSVAVTPLIQTDGDRSKGIFVQSVGGGGGNGGFAAAASVGYIASASVAVGGTGGDGGDGGTVHVNGTTDIITDGIDSDGMLAQSVGGGGGNGGFAVSFAGAAGDAAGVALGVGVGGKGGKGGQGGDVTLRAGGDILTQSAQSEGLIAQSVGGGGGTGGFSVTLTAAGSGGVAGAVSVGVGGSGGDGGSAGTVDAKYAGNVVTLGDDSNAMLIQGVGGGGGNGGFSVSGAVSGAASASGAVAVGVGGSGGGGGDGGVVKADVTGNIGTAGDRSSGLVAQSIGGRGGNGGFNISGTITGSGGGSGAVSVGVGGAGGGAGNARSVEATLVGNAATLGEDADAVLVQSVGGGGGNGAFNVSGSISASAEGSVGVSVGVGGAGGDGGAGGTVDADVTGDLETVGANSNAFMAQSLGGGGGNGGFNVSGAISASGGPSGAVSVGVGGSGGGGGAGSTVNATLTGSAITHGTDATAVIAQSVGGGGGTGGFNVSGALSAAKGISGAVAVGVGGAGGAGGAGGQASLSVTGDVSTEGDGAGGVLAQSLGGGGGAGGINVAGGLSLSTDTGGTLAVGVGGAGGLGGSSGAVDATLDGSVLTTGDNAAGFTAQSIGGGGGNGGFNVSGGISASGGSSGALSVGVGGSGGGGGASSSVNATLTGSATTRGADAIAVIAQSVGGGGGTGGLNVSGSISASKGTGGTLTVGVGGAGGGGGAAGSTTLSVTGDVSTEGDGSGGVLAQSLGGGGGAGGINVAGGLSLSTESGGALAVGIGGAGGLGGSSGAVDATLDGSVLTTGDNAAGFTAQSIGGGGGTGGLNVSGSVSLTKSTGGSISVGVGGFGGDGGTASTVVGNVTGDVTTTGTKSTGVLAQSVGGGGGNGGLNVSGAIGLSTETGVGVAIGVGGFGGSGGTGGAVTLHRTGTTMTSGAGADAVVAQSLGGGGGNGGLNVTGGISASSGKNAFSATIGVGGFGGSGGTAANVVADVSGDVIATGLGSDGYVFEDGIWVRQRKDGSNAVLAQSLGGGGGNGALNVSGGIALAPPKSGESNALNIGVGGFGGTGGNAGAVTLGVEADEVRAVGDDRYAVGAQSIGGGGGNGGLNVSGGIALDGQLTAGVGGFGGGGGTAGAVDVSSAADLFAAGNGAVGLLAQSVGGGGGKGGINISGGLQPATTSKSASLVFGLGGFGGAGNVSSTVDATQRGAISVEGVDSIGILVQSVAGGGGAGGLNVSGSGTLGKGYTATIGIGGSGGSGADAGAVSLVSDGAIRVDGREPYNPDEETTAEQRETLNFRERANGILVQSVGGGGGSGGMNVTGVLAPNGSPLAAGVGGTGGGGGNAGAVTVERGIETPSLLETHGRDANGLTAQSIGGGGGNAGMNFVVEGSGWSANSGSKQAIFAIGGGGGDPGHGSTVDVTHVGDIATDGHQSDGILAQSVGGGGGNATFNIGFGVNRDAKGLNLAVGGAPGEGGDGNTVTVGHAGNITTQGADSTAIFAQSVGGGGGNAGLDVAMSLLGEGSLDIGVGRKGGSGGTGGDVVVTSDGTLVTHGDRSVGVLAQSVGNGGGKSGSYSFGLSAKSTSGEGKTQTTESSKISVKVGIEGGTGGTAGSVDVTTSGIIATEGKDAHAIQAQSVGGGGGIGGAAMNFVLGNTQAVNVGVGGEGGTGGSSGTVNVDNAAIIETLGDGAHGIYAQSIGGGGGVGGYAGVAELNFFGAAVKEGSHTLAVSVGGSGGEGADGNTVTVGNTGSILTHGDKAFGISAQSIGGGGGDGGLVFDASIVGGKETTSLRVNVGGFGGEGGVGKDVTVVNSGTIHTLGKDSIGIRAESLGGGGGDAGLVGTLRIGTSGGETSAGSMIVNIGGVGGTGGKAGNVDVENIGDGDATGSIVTEGEGAHGIFAQSLGGGGGNGSSILSANLAGGKGSALVGINIGGAGGSGGTGGNVSVANEATIATLGDKAHGVFAQSIGGGGGNGGLVVAGEAIFAKGANEATALVALGGAGGSGDDAGSVTIDNSGSIVTEGRGAHGIYAQSIGGGGGNAGIGVGLTSGIASNIIGGAISAAFGGRGGEGGLGGQVTVRHSGDITVFGDNAQAVVAESINGGGGHVALDFQGITSLPGGEALPGAPSGTDTEPVFVFNGGGKDTQDSNANRVTLDYTGTFGAAGRNGAANSAQSIGGGGGTYNLDLDVMAGSGDGQAVTLQGTLGGQNGSNNDGGDIEGSQSGNLVTTGANTPGLLMQSIGGGGGRASLDVSADPGTLGAGSFTLGGVNGSNENGGTITQSQSGSINTAGTAADGALLQSIGGGGGSITYLLEQGQPSAAASKSVVGFRKLADGSRAVDDTTLQPTVEVQLGSDGGSGLDGGAIELDLTGDVSTAGDSAAGLVLQSIGGGGGKLTAVGSESLAVTLGGSGGASGNGADLDVSHTGDVVTQGARAHGVFLQSIGGGGGAVFTDVEAPAVTRSAANAGDGGQVNFEQVGDIATTGTEAYGLVAQSLGGGGGFVDGAFHGNAGGAGVGGDVTLAIDGDVVALGDRSTALFVQSSGRDGAGALSAMLASGHNIVGGTDGVAVEFDGGTQNLFENFGSVMTLSGVDGLAFSGGSGDDAIVNHGVVLGSIDMGEGANSFANLAGAALYAGEFIGLGDSTSMLQQDGLLAPAAAGRAVVVLLDGSLQQSAGAVSGFDVDFAADVIDSVLATGTVVVDGTLDVSLVNVWAIRPGAFRKVVYYGAAGLTDLGLELVAPTSVVIGFDLSHPDDDTAALAYQVDFAPDGLVGNRTAIGDYVNKVQSAGSAPALADTITALVLTPELEPYAAMLTELGPEFYAEQQVSAINSAQRFVRILQDCGSFVHRPRPKSGWNCAWGRFDYESSSRDASSGFPASEEIARRYSAGYQQDVDGGWLVGFGVDAEHNDATGFGGRWRAETGTFQLGALARRANGATSFGGVLMLGNAEHEVRRLISLTDDVVATGNRNIPFVTAVLDVTHRLDWGSVGVTPAINLGLANFWGGSVLEQGAGSLDLVIDDDTEFHSWVEPTLGIDLQGAFGNDKLVRAYARVGLLYFLTDDVTEVAAGWRGAPAGVPMMRVGSDLDRSHFNAEGGFELVAKGGYAVSLSYALQTSDNRDSDTGALRIRIPVH